MILKENELCNIKGGANAAGVAAILTAIGVFIAGVVDGIIRPLRCN